MTTAPETPVPTTARASARVAAALLGVVVLFQVAVAAGAPWGSLTQGGRHPGRLPAQGRAVAGASAVVLVLMGLALLARAGDGPLARAPRPLVAVLSWSATAYLGVGVVLNLLTPSPVERAVWAPTTAVLLASAFLTVWTTRVRTGTPGRLVPRSGDGGTGFVSATD